jgi:hypothetical protein
VPGGEQPERPELGDARGQGDGDVAAVLLDAVVAGEPVVQENSPARFALLRDSAHRCSLVPVDLGKRRCLVAHQYPLVAVVAQQHTDSTRTGGDPLVINWAAMDDRYRARWSSVVR